MDEIIKLIECIANNKDAIVEVLGLIIKMFAYIVLIASTIIKIVPKLDDKNKLKPIIKIVGKYLAMNRDISKEK